jgi:hypothetical protein
VEAEDEDIKEVYAHFGLAAYFGQCLETTLVNVLMLDARVRGETACLADIEKLEHAHQRKPMGALIKELRKKTTLPLNPDDDIGDALDKRNYLNHRFFREHAEAFLSCSGRQKMLMELAEIQKVLQEADQMMTLVCGALIKFLGITPEMLNADFEELQRKARQGI